MNFRTTLSVLFFAAIMSGTFAQSYKRTSLGVKTNIQSMDIEVQFYSDQIIRVLKQPEGSILKKTSLSVIMEPKQARLAISDQNNIVTLKSEKVQAQLNLATGRVTFTTLNGTPLLTEKDYGTQFTAVRDAGKASFSVRQAFLLDKNEVIYGLGQQQNGRLNQRGQKIYLRLVLSSPAQARPHLQAPAME